MATEDVHLLQLDGVTETNKGVIGRGAYGRVFEVSTLCAAKEVHQMLIDDSNPEDLAELKQKFLQECLHCSHLYHPNIVQFLGVYYPSKNAVLPWLVMEKMECSLKQYLMDHEPTEVSFKLRMSILHDISLGLNYLHVQDIIHRDLSSNNVLLTKQLVAKISDLGVAKAINPNHSKTATQAPGTLFFMPPEALSALSARPKYGKPVDVFSLGCVMIHVMTHIWPTPTDKTGTDENTGELVAYSEMKRREYYLEIYQIPAKLKQLISQCLQDNPKRRPHISGVSRIIRELQPDLKLSAVQSILLNHELWQETNQSSLKRMESGEAVTGEAVIGEGFTRANGSISSLEHRHDNKKSGAMEITSELIDTVKRSQDSLEKVTELVKDLREAYDKLRMTNAKVTEEKSDADLMNRRLLDAVNEMELKQQTFRQEYEALRMIFSSIEQGDQEVDQVWLKYLHFWHPNRSKILEKSPSTTTGDDTTLEIADDVTLPSACPENIINSLDAHDGEISACNFSGRGTYFATGGSDKLVKIWTCDSTTGQCSKLNTLVGSKGGIMSVEFDDQEKYVLAASTDHSALLWSVSKSTVTQTMTGHRDKVFCAKFLDAERVVTGSLDRKIKIWDLQRDDTAPKSLFASAGCTDLIAGKSTGFSIISGHTDKKIRFWDMQDKSISIQLTGKVTSLDLSPDQTLLLCCTQDDTLRLIDLRQNRICTILTAVGFKVSVGWCRARFSPDGQYVAAGSSDGTLFVWETVTGMHTTLKQHNYAVVGCAWHPNGQLVVGVDRNKKIIVWK